VEEGIANVVLESMAIGTLVISSDCGGMKEIIQNNINGLIFESRNVTELTEKMKHVIKLHENQKIKIISNARQTIHDNHDLNVLGSKMKKLYQNALL
jgi:colanic acid/amylovoran biosynthesis glycosyltransferase